MKTPWRVGRKVGRTLYDAEDNLIGVMDTQELAALVVEAVNNEAVSWRYELPEEEG